MRYRFRSARGCHSDPWNGNRRGIRCTPGVTRSVEAGTGQLLRPSARLTRCAQARASSYRAGRRASSCGMALIAPEPTPRCNAIRSATSPRAAACTPASAGQAALAVDGVAAVAFTPSIAARAGTPPPAMTNISPAHAAATNSRPRPSPATGDHLSRPLRIAVLAPNSFASSVGSFMSLPMLRGFCPVERSAAATDSRDRGPRHPGCLQTDAGNSLQFTTGRPFVLDKIDNVAL